MFETMPISITSTYEGPYEDKFTDDGLLIYRYRGMDPNHRDNIGLLEAMKSRTPLIYFHGIMRGRYLPVWPVFVMQNSPEELFCMVAVDPIFAFGVNAEGYFRTEIKESSLSVRKYVMAYTKQRLHQSSFREKVIFAYDNRCSLCALGHRELLDAAHIIPDADEGGEPIIQNGLSLCKIHHAAFDVNIIGISPDYLVSVREDILLEHDGPMLRYGLQELEKQKLLLPRKKENWPDKERLDMRFHNFQMAG
ncbi:MAG: HNH endonuclease [Chlorobi bacterium]|nr:HNH endonuclease [Chlorobiota bacterium]